jgi:hypothetical protein
MQIFLNVVQSWNAAFLDFRESAISYNQIFQFCNIEGKSTYVQDKLEILNWLLDIFVQNA